MINQATFGNLFELCNDDINKVLNYFQIWNYQDNSNIEISDKVKSLPKDIHDLQNKIVIIDFLKQNDINIYIFCFESSILIINVSQCAKNFLEEIFKKSDENAENNNFFSIFYTSKKCENEFIADFPSVFEGISFSSNDKNIPDFDLEISNFINSEKCRLKSGDENLWNLIKRALIGFIIKKSYFVTNEIFKPTNAHPYSEFINIRKLNKSDEFESYLCYNVKTRFLYILQHYSNKELFERVLTFSENSQCKLPFFPQYIGKIEEDGKQYLIFQFIEGEIIFDSTRNFDQTECISIGFEILTAFAFLHLNGLTLQDLRMNILITPTKHSIFCNYCQSIQSYLGTDFEIFMSFLCDSFKFDIYLFGLTLYCISENISLKQLITSELTEKIKQSKGEICFETCKMQSMFFQSICKNCFEKRSPFEIIQNEYLYTFSIYIKQKYINLSEDELNYIKSFLNTFINIINEMIQKEKINSKIDISYVYLFLSTIYRLNVFTPTDPKQFLYYIQNSIQGNNPVAQARIGMIYLEKDINKALHFLNLSLSQKNSYAQRIVGNLYLEGKKVQRNLSKGMHYLTLSANQGDAISQTELGIIYSRGEMVEKNFDKGIDYLMLSASQFEIKAIYTLGVYYFKGIGVEKNIKKSLKLLNYAINEMKDIKSMLFLGISYLEGKEIERDMRKSIYYLTIASKNNCKKALFYLGLIFSGNFKEFLIYKNLKKAKQYLKLVSNYKSNYQLGLIYLKKEKIDKSIHYLELSQEKYVKAFFLLGIIYLDIDINQAIHYLTLASNQNNAKAQIQLGLIYLEGKLIKRDIDKSLNYFKLASNQNDPRALFYLGKIYLEGEFVNEGKRGVNKGILDITVSANRNDSMAQFYLGCVYLEGKFVERDIDKSLYYFSLGVTRNDIKSIIMLAFIYYKGIYISKNINTAIYYLSLASNLGNCRCQYELGKIYYEGILVNQDINKAVYLFKQASNQNDLNSQYKLGKIYYYELFNIERAIYYFTLAAKNNDPKSKCKLGLIYIDGKFVPKNCSLAINYLMDSANLNYSKAQYLIGKFYYEGQYLPFNISKAINFLLKASENGDLDASSVLGLIYYEGQFVIKNIEKALNYLEKAAKFMNPFALYTLGKIYYDGIEVKRDINKAIHLLEKAAYLNDSYAYYLIGKIYYEGKYVQQDIELGYFFLRKSAHLKNSRAHIAVSLINEAAH